MAKAIYSDATLIASPYFKSNTSKILVASDIHYHPHVDKHLYELLVEYSRETSPDFIIMPGDLI